MKHDESGEITEGLEGAENPMYEVGESVILQHGHMPGMEGAEATVSGVFATTAYEVSFNQPMVENERKIIAGLSTKKFLSQPKAHLNLEKK